MSTTNLAPESSNKLLNETFYILVVEDDAEIRLMYEVLLESDRYKLLLTGSATHALELFFQHSKSIQVVVTDGHLGNGPHGLWLVQEIRKTSAVPIILVSGKVNEFKNESGFSMINAVLEKPFNASGLQQTLKQFLASSPPFRA